MERTITVKGTGSISKKPDLIDVSITLITHKQEYSETMQQAAFDFEELQAAIMGCGLEKEKLKTEDYSISVRQKQTENKDGFYEWVADGYACEHRLNIGFGFDTDLLGDLLYRISSCKSNPQMNIAFSIKDKEEAKLKLLENAVADSKAKAEILTKTAQVQLEEILHIDYSWNDLYLNSPTSYKIQEDMHLLGAGPAINITPQDVNATETVTVTWRIQ